jgi:gluconolactonase
MAARPVGKGRLLNCEGDGRLVTRLEPDGSVTTLADRFEGKRLNRPNDVICHSNGTIYFTDPDLRVPLADREIGQAAIYRVTPDGSISELAPFEYPNGLALSKDERTLYVANTRWTQYIHALELDAGGRMVRRRVFADMSTDGTNGVPDGMKIDDAGRVFCTGTGGVWVFEPDGTRIGIIEMPEVCANIAFGGPDLRTLLLTASTSVYTLRVRTPGRPHPWYKLRGG